VAFREGRKIPLPPASPTIPKHLKRERETGAAKNPLKRKKGIRKTTSQAAVITVEKRRKKDRSKNKVDKDYKEDAKTLRGGAVDLKPSKVKRNPNKKNQRGSQARKRARKGSKGKYEKDEGSYAYLFSKPPKKRVQSGHKKE